MAEYVDGAIDILGGSVTRYTLNTTTPYQAVIRKVIAGSGISITYTGVDAGTGDVTISAIGGGAGGVGTGTVTSVAMTVPTGFTITGSPITASGTLTLGIASGFVMPTSTNVSNWNTAFGWGNHAIAGYITGESDTLNSVTTRGSVTTNIIRIGGIYATSAQTTVFGSEANYFTSNRVLSSGAQGFKIKGFGSDLSFWRYDDGSGDVEIGNVTNYGVKIYTNNAVALTIYNNGDTSIGSPAYSSYKLDVNGSVRAGTSGYYGYNGSSSAPLIKFTGTNLIQLDPQGYGATTGFNLTINGYGYTTGRFVTDSYVISKGGSQTPGTTFVSYGIGRPDTNLQVTSLAGVGGVYEGSVWFNGLGLVFFVSSAADISGGASITEKMRLKANGDLVVNNLAGTGTRMVVADASGLLSTQTIPSGGSGVTLSLTTTGSSGAATYNSGTGALNIPNYTLAGLGGISLVSLAATTPLSYNNTTGVFTIQVATSTQNGYLSSTDWSTFNGKQAALNGTGFVKITGTSITYDNSTYSLDTAVVHLSGTETITGAKTFSGNVLLGTNGLRYDSGSGTIGIGLSAAPTSSSFVEIAASTTTKSTIRFTSGVAVTTPASGDLWYTAGSLYFYNGTTTIALSNGTITSVSASGSVSGIVLSSNTSSGAVTITLGGTLSVLPSNFSTQTQNTFLAAPSGTSGVPSFRTILAADIPTLNQNTTGSAATLTTPRAIYGNNFDGSAALTQIIASTYGGTGNGFTKFTGPTTAEKTFTLPDASATILTTNAAVTVAQGGTGATTLTGILVGNGTSAVTAITGTGSQLLRRNAGNTAYEFFTPTYSNPGDTFFIGTTSIANNRASAAQALTGITSIDGSAASVANSVTFNTTGGAAAGTTYNGSAARTIDYTTVGAAAASHTHAWSAITSGLPTTISGYGITDAYTKTEVDSFLQGLDPKASVKVATTANITLSGTQTIDGIAVVAGDRVLVKDQTTGSQNGIYVVAAGAWSRATDMDAAVEFPGSFCFVEQGTANQDSAWVCTNDAVTLGTTAVTFVKFAGSGAYQAALNGTGYVKMSGTTVSYLSSIPITDLAASTISGISLGNNLAALTINNSGTGAASGSTYNGSTAVTISYNSIGAQPLASNLTSLAALSWSTGTTPFVKMTAAGTFALDTNTYLTSITLTGDVTSTGFATTIASGAVTLAKMANLAANSIIGNNTGTAATPLALTGTQVTAMLDNFTSTTKGLVPLSGGGTTNFLRADGSWAAPAGGGGGSSTSPLVSKGGAFTILSSDANFTHYIMTVSPVAVTNASGNGTTITYTSSGGFTAGQKVTIKGVVPVVYNLTDATIATVGAGQFTVTNGAVGTFVSAGTALSNNVITVPADSTSNVTVGYEFMVTSIGTGDVVFTPEAGVTLTSATGSYTMSGQYSSARIIKTAANTWRLYLDNGVLVFNRQYSAAYTLTLQDSNKVVEMNVDQTASAVNTVTIPLNSAVPFPIGTQIIVTQYGTSSTLISPTSGVSIRSTADTIQLAGQYTSVTMIKVGTDEWYIYGALVRKNDLQIKSLASPWSNAAGTANGYQDVTGLSFPIVANGVYYFKFTVWYTTALTTTSAMFSVNTITATIATNGLRYTSSYYGGAANTAITAPTITTNTNLTAVNSPATSPANPGITTSTTSGFNTAIVEGYIRVGTTGGTLVLRAASELAAAGGLTIVTGSFIQYTRLV